MRVAGVCGGWERGVRIVSLIPSATEIVCGLGLREQLVGVTHECDYPAGVERLPHVTRSYIPAGIESRDIHDRVVASRERQRALYSLRADVMRSLRPELIISQTLCDVCAVDDREVRAFVEAFSGGGGGRGDAGGAGSERGERGAAPRVVYLEPKRLADVLGHVELVARAAGVEERGRRVAAELRGRLERLAGAAAGASGGRRPRVLVLEWLDPLFSCGHWTPELVELAGGREPVGRAGERSRVVEVREVLAADPDVIVIACCGFGVQRALVDVPAFVGDPQISRLRCVRERRVYVVDGSAYFSRPGPRLVDSAELLGHILWPGVVERPVGAEVVRFAFPAAMP